MLTFFRNSLFSLCLLTCVCTFSQQDAQYTQYMYSATSINPAYVGSRNTFNFIAMHRSQWIGIEGAPITQLISVNSALGERQGIGLSIFRDQIGPSIETTITSDYSYNLRLNKDDLIIAFGIKIGVHSLNVDFNKLIIHNPNDPFFSKNISNRISPMIGLGTYLFTEKWYVGFSIPNFLKTTHYNTTSISNATKSNIHFYGMAGYVFDLSDGVKFKPTGLLKVANGAPIAIDISSNFVFYSKFSLGVSYRLSKSVSGVGSFQLSKNLMLGYSYDYGVNNLGKYNNGSHEFLLRYELPVNQRRPKYLRCF